ncbi:bacillithiol biosynthesis cysteine-adding enzyme BshC [Fodinibius sediminis]|uniref:bacillithiol biosynthesis cysteine-adding enzyme BshC n=1 Tax=Fodinibius sediminis TaxID=1214077 RepID=UPI00163D82B6|nr:bacillithiol biosynthesis cysteine-adding enzyme BshC [Fodinibius sediminis]
MQRINRSFEHLPFSSLFKTYISDFSRVDAFYDYNPFDREEIEAKARQHQYRGDRRQMTDLLRAFNDPYDLHENALQNLDRLQQDDALAVVTGQQLGLYGGPLYTVLKTISVIHIARQMEAQLDRPVIPVFWLADEDHDYEEVRSVYAPGDGKLQTYELPSRSFPLPPVAEMKIPGELEQLRNAMRSDLYETDFSSAVWELLDHCFYPGTTYAGAFGNFISRLFSRHGLVLAGSNDPGIKEFVKGVVYQSVEDAEDIRKALEGPSGRMKEQFHQQVTLYDSNLFYISGEGNRLKINASTEGWATEQGHQWTREQLLQEVEENPELFSPNVFLRPIMQDKLIPTLGYVAGPGELAYYGQMKQLYARFDAKMPIIYPRLSATLVEPAVDRIFDELPFEFHEYANRIEDLDAAYVEHTEKMDIEAIFSEWKEKVGELARAKKKKVATVDPTLEGAAGKATAVYFGELDKLKGKVYRAVKQQDQTQLNRIRRIKQNLFPRDNLQERSVAAIYFMNKFGLDIWDELLASLDEQETFDQHKVIKL